jgi:hypothetical protein
VPFQPSAIKPCEDTSSSRSLLRGEIGSEILKARLKSDDARI